MGNGSGAFKFGEILEGLVEIGKEKLGLSGSGKGEKISLHPEVRDAGLNVKDKVQQALSGDVKNVVNRLAEESQRRRPGESTGSRPAIKLDTSGSNVIPEKSDLHVFHESPLLPPPYDQRPPLPQNPNLSERLAQLQQIQESTPLSNSIQELKTQLSSINSETNQREMISETEADTIILQFIQKNLFSQKKKNTEGVALVERYLYDFHIIQTMAHEFNVDQFLLSQQALVMSLRRIIRESVKTNHPSFTTAFNDLVQNCVSFEALLDVANIAVRNDMRADVLKPILFQTLAQKIVYTKSQRHLRSLLIKLCGEETEKHWSVREVADETINDRLIPWLLHTQPLPTKQQVIAEMTSYGIFKKTASRLNEQEQFMRAYANRTYTFVTAIEKICTEKYCGNHAVALKRKCLEALRDIRQTGSYTEIQKFAESFANIVMSWFDLYKIDTQIPDFIKILRSYKTMIVEGIIRGLNPETLFLTYEKEFGAVATIYKYFIDTENQVSDNQTRNNRVRKMLSEAWKANNEREVMQELANEIPSVVASSVPEGILNVNGTREKYMDYAKNVVYRRQMGEIERFFQEMRFFRTIQGEIRSHGGAEQELVSANSMQDLLKTLSSTMIQTEIEQYEQMIQAEENSLKMMMPSLAPTSSIKNYRRYIEALKAREKELHIDIRNTKNMEDFTRMHRTILGIPLEDLQSTTTSTIDFSQNRMAKVETKQRMGSQVSQQLGAYFDKQSSPDVRPRNQVLQGQGESSNFMVNLHYEMNLNASNNEEKTRKRVPNITIQFLPQFRDRMTSNTSAMTATFLLSDRMNIYFEDFFVFDETTDPMTIDFEKTRNDLEVFIRKTLSVMKIAADTIISMKPALTRKVADMKLYTHPPREIEIDVNAGEALQWIRNIIAPFESHKKIVASTPIVSKILDLSKKKEELNEMETQELQQSILAMNLLVRACFSHLWKKMQLTHENTQEIPQAA